MTTKHSIDVGRSQSSVYGYLPHMLDALALGLANVCSISHNFEEKWYYIIFKEDVH